MPRRKLPEDYHELASRRGFEWLGPIVSNAVTKTNWGCGYGHVWPTRYSVIYEGYGCPFCSGSVPKRPEDYHRVAKEKGIMWIGPYVKTTKTNTGWQCSEGHIWNAIYQNVRKKHYGCPVCDGRHPLTLNSYLDLAKQRGFEYLERDVRPSREPVRWKCPKGHIWKTRYGVIKTGSACPQCLGVSRKTVADYHNIAQENDIFWIGENPVPVREKSKWMCKKGHIWESTYSHIRIGQCCYMCVSSSGEHKIALFLESHNIKYKTQKFFDDCRNVHRLPFDFYFEMDNQDWLVEYDGEQHYRPVKHFGGNKAFVKRKNNDIIKNKFAKENGYKLIRVPYFAKDINGYLNIALGKQVRLFDEIFA